MSNIIHRAVAVFCLLLAAFALGFYIDAKHHIKVLEAQASEAFRNRATELGATPAIIVPQGTRIVNTPRNSNTIKELKKVDPGTSVDEFDNFNATLNGIIAARQAPPADTWQDTHNRFSLNLQTHEFTRKQEFHLQAVVVESTTGAKVMTSDFQELDPVTHEPITDETPAVLTTSFSVVKKAPEVNVFHPRLVAAIGYLGQVGLGVELLNFERFGGVMSHANLSVEALYDISTKKATGAATLGFRPFNWNLSVGPAYFFPGNAFGAAATLELTR